MRRADLSKGLSKFLSVILSFLMVFSLIPAVAFAAPPAASAVEVGSEDELNAALADTTAPDILITANIDLVNTVSVNRPVNIDGGSHIIKGPAADHGIVVLADNVALSHLTITGSGRSNLQFYTVSGGSLDNVTLSDAANAGLIVNGSEVTVTNVTTMGNAWGGINVDQGSGVADDPHLTVSGATTHVSPSGKLTPAIWVDDGARTDWVTAPGLYAESDANGMHLYFDKAEYTAATTRTVKTEAELNAALADASVANILIGDNFDLAHTVNVNRTVSIDGGNHTIKGPAADHGIVVLANNVTISNLTIKNSGRSNLQFYKVTGGMVSNVRLAYAANAGLIVNGSEVTVSDVATTYNAWGGINVDQGSGVTEIPHLAVAKVTTHVSPSGKLTPAIWVDKGSNTDWVTVPESGSYTQANTGTMLLYYDNAEYTAASSTVTDEATLRAALTQESVKVIHIGNDFAVANTVEISREVRIEGHGKTITGPKTGSDPLKGHGFTVLANNVAFSKLTIMGSRCSNLQFYKVTGGTLNDVTLSDAANAGLIINGSKVTVSHVTTTGNVWGGINVDQGVGVSTATLLTVADVTTHTSPASGITPAIWLDKGTNLSWVSAAGKYTEQDASGKHYYFDKAEYIAAAELAAAKTAAVTDLNAYKTASTDYSPTNWDLIVAKRAAGVAAINNAASMDAVSTALQVAKDDIDTVKTKVQEAQAAALNVTNETELRAALTNPAVSAIRLAASFAIGSTVDIRKSVSIDGQNFTITGPSAGYGFTIYANDVSFSKLTITGSAKSNLNFYKVTGGSLSDVTLSNSLNAGMIVNGSKVTVSHVTTTNNAWGGINVDQGVGVTTDTLLTVTDVTTHTSPAGGMKPAIWMDKGEHTEWVSAPEAAYTETAAGGVHNYYDKAEYTATTTRTVTTEDQLNAALADSAILTVYVGANFNLLNTVNINRTVAIVGKGHTITGPTADHGIVVLANNVAISDLTITASGKSNLQFYKVTGGSLSHVTLSDAKNAGLIVNGSEVTVSHVTTAGNAWGGINVDQGSGVMTIPHLTVSDATTHTSPASGLTPAIWIDKGTNTAWVSAAGLYTETDATPMHLYYDKAEYAKDAALKVTNENELNAALSSQYVSIIHLAGSFTLSNTVNIDRTVSIDGKGYTITGPVSNHGIVVLANDVSISDLTITKSGKSNLQFYKVTGGSLSHVTLSDAKNAGLIVNGSKVTVSHVTTTNNAWGGINVDQGVGVTTDTLLTVTDVTAHTSPASGLTPAIWIDKGTNTAWVSAAGLYTETDANPMYLYFDKAEYATKALADAKTAALAELNAYQATELDYSPANWTLVQGERAKGITAINGAGTPAVVTAALNDAKDAIDTIKTTAQETKDAQDAALKVTSEAELNAALNSPYVSAIRLAGSFSLSDTVNVNRTVSIDGDGYTITGPASAHGIVVLANDVSISDLTITASGKSNLQFYVVTGGSLSHVTLSDAKNAGLIVNGSEVKVSHVTTAGNIWGGINVDQGSGVMTIPHLTVSDVTTHASPASGLTPAIWIDKGANTAWVSAAGLYTETDATPMHLYFDKDEYAAKELAEAKTAALAELNAYQATETDYGPANWALVEDERADGVTAINAATTPAAVADALKDAKDAIDAIQTVAQEAKEAQDAALDVKSEAALRSALNSQYVSVIHITGNITLGGTVDINSTVSIDGLGHTITGPAAGHGFTVFADDVAISNLTITGSKKSNLNFYLATGGSLSNVTLAKAGNAGIIVNGSKVKISHVTTTGNAWGGINVDQGVGVLVIPLLEVTDVTTHTSPASGITPAIWVDKGVNTGWVSAYGKGMYTESNSGDAHLYYDKTEYEKVKKLTGIAVKNSPKTTYIEGQSFDPAGLTLTASYDNGTSETITTGYTIGVANPLPKGESTVTITYGGKQTTLKVTANARALTGILVKAAPKTSYIEGQSFDPAGLTLTASYDNGTTDTISTGYTIGAASPLPVGDSTVTITYGGKQTTLKVTAAAKSLVSIAITTKPAKTSYSEGQSFDATGMVVTASYNNGTTAAVTGYTTAPSAALTTADTKITVAYEGKTAELAITVLSKGSLRVTTKDTTGAIYAGVGLSVYSDRAMTLKVGEGVADAATGAVQIFGLDAGTYWVVVASVPTGYKMPSSNEPIDFKVEYGPVTNATLVLEKSKTYAYNNSQLTNIQSTAGTLSPAFDPETLRYTLTLDENTASVKITPVLADSASKLTINGKKATNLKVALTATGAKATVTIKVQPKSGKALTYTVVVTRSKSANATLASLKASKGTLTPKFSPAGTAYTLELPNTQSSVTFTAKLAEKHAISANYLDGKKTASKTVSLKPGQTKTLIISVKAQKGNITNYTITVHRAISHNADLAGLSASKGALTPAFAAVQTTYALALTSAQASTALKVKAADATATVAYKVSGKAATKTVRLDKGAAKVVSVIVKSQAGDVKTYTVTVTRAK